MESYAVCIIRELRLRIRLVLGFPAFSSSFRILDLPRVICNELLRAGLKRSSVLSQRVDRRRLHDEIHFSATLIFNSDTHTLRE